VPLIFYCDVVTGALSNASKAGRSRTGSWGQARLKKTGTGSAGRKVAEGMEEVGTPAASKDGGGD
jgi:hypothetical protein